MQFGHNDSSPINETVPNSRARSRGTIRGVGDETQAITNILTKKFEVVHSFGWYEKQMITEARAKGATPMVCSLIPRNNWKNGRAVRNKKDYAGWAEKRPRPNTRRFSTSTKSSRASMTRSGRKK